jgi:hypothetical protein
MILYTIFTIGLSIDIDNYYFLTKIKQNLFIQNGIDTIKNICRLIYFSSKINVVVIVSLCG